MSVSRNNFPFLLWLVNRQLRSGGRFLGMTTLLSIFGMAIGVASLVISMSVVSGFDTALKSAVIDFSGHIILLKHDSFIDAPEDFIPRLRKISPSIISYTPFVQLEAVVAESGKTAGVSVIGMNDDSVAQAMDLRKRIIGGDLRLGSQGGYAEAVIGKGLAKKFNFKLGQIIQIVTPRPTKGSTTGFSPKSAKLKITGIVDLGQYEYDSRFILIGSDPAMELRGGQGFTGLRLRLTDEKLAEGVKYKLIAELGNPYWAKSWFDVSRNLFEAIQIEKRVILIVVLLMVVTACFNICSTLFVNVLKRYTDIGILQTMGASPKFIKNLFAMQGMVIGMVGCLLGLALGICIALYLPHTVLFQIPGEVYKLDHLEADLRISDLALILFSSMLICFISTFAPARKGSKLKPVDGLRYE